MGEKVSFKVFLQDQNQGEDKEVRRFDVEKNISASFSSLEQRIYKVFPKLQQKIFSVFWSDKDGDMVTIGSDEELAIALAEMPRPVYKIFIKVKKEEKNRNGLGVSFDEPGNTPRYILEQPGARNNSQCILCDQYGDEVPQNLLNFRQPEPEIVFPKKLLKQIQKIHGKAGKNKFDPKNGFQDTNLVQSGVEPPSYFGLAGYGRGLFHSSLRGGFRGQHGPEGIHGSM